MIEPWGGEVRLASAEAGQLTELGAREGDLVTRGQVLARFEDSRQRHAVAIAEAELRQARAALGGVESSAEDLQAAEAEVEVARARADQATRDGARRRRLGEHGALPPAEVDPTNAEASAAQAALAAATARLASIRRGARTSDRALLRARAEAAQARLDEARAALERRLVRAPGDAVVLWSRYHVGEFYSPGPGALMVLGERERLQARLEGNDLDAAAVRVGARCDLRGDAGELLGRGTVVRTAPEFGSRSLSTERPTGRSDARVLEVFLQLDPKTRLAPGRWVWGYIDRGPRQAEASEPTPGASAGAGSG